MVWAEDNRTLFYTRKDPVTLRAFRIFRHRLGEDSGKDALVYEEKDETFSVYVTKSASRKYLFIESSQTLSDEVRFLDAGDPEGEFRVILPRERDHEYDVDHLGDRFYIRTNDRAKNFRLVSRAGGARHAGRVDRGDSRPRRRDAPGLHAVPGPSRAEGALRGADPHPDQALVR